MLRNILTIFLREYLQAVRTKAFIIITVLMPLIFAALFLLPVYFATRSGGARRIAIVETAPSGAGLLPALQEELERRTGGIRQTFRFESIPYQPGSDSSLRDRLRKDVMAGKYDGFLWVEGDAGRDGAVEYNGRTLTDLAGLRILESAVSRAVVKQRLVARGVPAGQVQELVKPTTMSTARVTASGSAQEERGVSFIMAFFFLMVLYTTLIIYGITVMRSVIEEKTSRIYEVLLSTVRPVELLAGKILGIAAVGLTQYLVWAVLGLIAGGGFGLAAVRSQVGDFQIPGQILVFFVVFFLMGFLLYSSMYAALGAMVNSEKEAQQLQMLVMQFLIWPMIVMQIVLRNPNSTASIALSLFPLFTPMLMFLRIAVEMPPAWQVALSILLLALTTIGMMWLAGRIYRVGILMYGKRPTLPELWRWVKAA